MTVNQKIIKSPIRIPMMITLPKVGECREGEIFYDLTNGKLALYTSEGFKYFTEDA